MEVVHLLSFRHQCQTKWDSDYLWPAADDDRTTHNAFATRIITVKPPTIMDRNSGAFSRGVALSPVVNLY